MNANKFSRSIKTQLDRVEPGCRFKVCLTKVRSKPTVYKLRIYNKNVILSPYINYADFPKWQKKSTSPEAIIRWITERMNSIESKKSK